MAELVSTKPRPLMGRELAADWRLRQREAFQVIDSPRVDVVLGVGVSGVDEPSERYLRVKRRHGELVGVDVREHRVDMTRLGKGALSRTVAVMSHLPAVRAMFVELPPPGFTEKEIADLKQLVDPRKDMDGVHPHALRPAATAMGALMFMDGHAIDLTDANVTVRGACSDRVGGPLCTLLRERGIEPEELDPKLGHDDEYARLVLKDTDVLFTSVGKEKGLKEEHLHDGMVIVDLGIDRSTGVGDLDPAVYASSLDIQYTPVIGGASTMTTVAAFENAYFAMTQSY